MWPAYAILWTNAEAIRLRGEGGDLREGAIELRTKVVRGDADGDTETHAG